MKTLAKCVVLYYCWGRNLRLLLLSFGTVTDPFTTNNSSNSNSEFTFLNHTVGCNLVNPWSHRRHCCFWCCWCSWAGAVIASNPAELIGRSRTDQLSLRRAEGDNDWMHISLANCRAQQNSDDDNRSAERQRLRDYHEQSALTNKLKLWKCIGTWDWIGLGFSIIGNWSASAPLRAAIGHFSCLPRYWTLAWNRSVKRGLACSVHVLEGLIKSTNFG